MISVTSIRECADPLPVRLDEPLAKVLSDLAVPRQRIEAVFLDVGRHLIDASRLLGSISAIFEGLALRLVGAEGEGTVSASEALARRVLAIAGSTNREAHNLGALITAVALIHEPIFELSRAIKSISHVAMGTRICAAQLTGGTDFGAFTTDIMRLSEKAAATVTNFAVVYERLVATLNTADAKRTMLDNTQNRTLGGLTERLESSLRVAAEYRRLSIAASGKIEQLFGRISAGIASVITELQIGDITRQRIEHVEEGLASLIEPAARLADTPSDQDTALIAAVCCLQSAQMEQATQDFEQGAVRIGEIICQLGSDAGDIVMQSREIHEETIEASSTALAGLTEEMRRACALIRECEAARVELDQASAAVNTSLENLVRCVRSVHDIKGEMHILGINMGLKCAQLGPEGRTLNMISQELRELAEKTVVHAQKAVEGLNEASTQAKSLTATASATVLSDIEQLEEKVRRSATMPQTDRCLKEALDLLVREGAQVVNLLTKSAEHATFQEEIGSTLHDAIAAINFLRAEARNVHAATGSGDGNLAEEVAFAQLKGRYTMASERALHDQYSGLPVNVGPKQPDVSAPEFDLDDIFL
jgi:hypothetical protein